MTAIGAAESARLLKTPDETRYKVSDLERRIFRTAACRCYVCFTNFAQTESLSLLGSDRVRLRDIDSSGPGCPSLFHSEYLERPSVTMGSNGPLSTRPLIKRTCKLIEA